MEWSKLLVWGLLLAPVLLLACTTRDEQTYTSNKMTAVATFYPLQYLAQRISGDRMEVTGLVPTGVEPHDYNPSPKDMVAIQRAELFIYNGAGLEAFAPQIIAGLPTDGPIVVNATQGLQMTTASAHGGEGNDPDPHVWLDPHLYSQQAQLIHHALAQADQDGAAVYNANLSLLQDDLAKLEREMSDGLASCSRNTVVTAHRAFGYMAEKFNLHHIALAGLAPEEEPSPAHMKQLIEEIELTGTSYIFFESLTTPAVAEAIARETGAKTLEMNPLEGLTKDQLRSGEDYFTIMRQNLANLRTALECQ
jgi:zinc transport system substrate-binding protein